jgi:hypothetical protein
MIHIQLKSPAPPVTVLAEIRDHSAQWRLSELPEWAQHAEILAVECRVRGAQYRLWYTRQWYWGPLRWLDLRGTAQPAPGGGTELAFSVGCRPQWYEGLPLVLVLGGLAFIVASAPLLWPMALIVPAWIGLNGWQLWQTNQHLTRPNEPQADYLVRRLEAALDRAAAQR